MDTGVLIVGAGLCGLMAAQNLQEHGRRVTVVDKGRSVGGRLATRRIGPGCADHGAQFFTVRSPEVRRWAENWEAAGLIFEWSRGWSDGSLQETGPADGYPRYAVHGGMNNLAKHLAADLDIHVNVRITEITSSENRWHIHSEDGKCFISEALILTPPVPQSLVLLDAGGVALSPTPRQALEKISYAPCLAGMFWVDGAVTLPPPGAIQRPEAPVSWIASNQEKGISPGANIITIHAGPMLSRQLWDAPASAALTELQIALQSFFAPRTSIIEAQLKRWRYALPTGIHPYPCLLTLASAPLAFAGDGFGGPRVEGAALSGVAAATAIESTFNP